ncbi:MAG: TIM barrel protein [Clostridia bacterium]|nr:TIM barrel protein [Clostridia bacterium]
MKTGVQLWGVLKDRRDGTMEALRALKRLGFNGIEPCIALGSVPGLEHVIWPRTWFSAHAGEIAEIGLEILSCHIFADDIVKQADEMALFAANTGIRQFVVKSPTTLTEESLRKAAEDYSFAADALAELGAALLLHNEAEDIVAKFDGKTAYECLLDLCEGKLGAQVDVGWVYAGGESPEALLERNAARVKSLHFKDFVGAPGTFTETVPGAGRVDTSACVAFARAHHCAGILDMDDFPGDMWSDLASALKAIS